MPTSTPQIVTRLVQLGESANPADNFFLRAEGDGTVSIARCSGGTPVATIDAAGNILCASSALLGYVVGGTVTQQANKGAAVTLNTPCGQIVTSAVALAGSAYVQFVVNNSLVTTKDIPTIASNGGGNYRCQVISVGAGYFVVQIYNQTTTVLSEAITINFSILKGGA